MSEYDFTFRGETLSSHGYMICEWESPPAGSAVTTDSQKSFSSISMFGGKRQPILYATYNETLSIRMSICKLSDAQVKTISPAESAVIKRWLGCSTPQELRLGEDKYNGYHWVGVFNIDEVHYAFGCIGFNLTFTSIAPFGYKDLVELTGNILRDGQITVTDTSDEEGYIYPDITITTKASGNLTITNSFDGRQTVINGCSNGETITFTNLLQIQTSKSSHNLGNDFNYKFVRINNDYSNRVNVLTFSLPCSYTISYKPIAKVVFV